MPLCLSLVLTHPECYMTAFLHAQEAELLAAREGRKGGSQLYYVDYSLLKPGIQRAEYLVVLDSVLCPGCSGSTAALMQGRTSSGCS